MNKNIVVAAFLILTCRTAARAAPAGEDVPGMRALCGGPMIAEALRTDCLASNLGLPTDRRALARCSEMDLDKKTECASIVAGRTFPLDLRCENGGDNGGIICLTISGKLDRRLESIKSACRSNAKLLFGVDYVRMRACVSQALGRK